ncbi:hypothetical protein X559_2043 [Paenilisteria newyorkensis]|nr:hypothetical protein X559_2043 [Listeria newyorkensis]
MRLVAFCIGLTRHQSCRVEFLLGHATIFIDDFDHIAVRVVGHARYGACRVCRFHQIIVAVIAVARRLAERIRLRQHVAFRVIGVGIFPTIRQNFRRYIPALIIRNALRRALWMLLFHQSVRRIIGVTRLIATHIGLANHIAKCIIIIRLAPTFAIRHTRHVAELIVRITFLLSRIVFLFQQTIHFIIRKSGNRTIGVFLFHHIIR